MKLTKELLTNYTISEDGTISKHGGRGKQGVITARKCRKGYMTVAITLSNGKRITTGLHRVLATMFIDNPDDKPEVNHINGIKDDNRLENLEWCTSSENQIHAFKNGLQTISSCNINGLSQGSLLPQSKLDEEIVYEIRVKRMKGTTYPQLSKEYNMSIGNLEKLVSPTRKTRTWKHVKYPTKEEE